MNIDPELLLLITVAAAGLAALTFVLNHRRQAREVHMADLGARIQALTQHFEALSMQLENRSRTTEEVVRELDKSLRGSAADMREVVTARLAESSENAQRTLYGFRETLVGQFGALQLGLEQRHSEALKVLQETISAGIGRVREQVTESLGHNTHELTRRIESLTESTDNRLKEISGQVERRLAEGFEKTTATFADVLKRLALIDEAQKKIAELSGSVVSLQEILADKRSRGAFGEVQLAGLIRNMMPDGSFALQKTLSNGNRADCMLYLPEPTGNIVIDAKFPLEGYSRMTELSLNEVDRRLAERQFKQDIRKHVEDIANRYIIPGETSDGAVMFIPAEAVFAEIHARHADLVELAQRRRVWLVSPTTLMAILTTARAVIKDEATREQVHSIQSHLIALSRDFQRFQQRMDDLARHIHQASKDVDHVHTSARKISSRFRKIESVEFDAESTEAKSVRAVTKDDDSAVG